MRWSYKTAHFSMKKEGLLGNSFLDEAEIEATLNEYGMSGWELVSLMEVNDGFIAVFKKTFSQNTTSSYEPVQEIVSQQFSEPATEMLNDNISVLSEATDSVDSEAGKDEGDVGAIKIM